MKAARFSVGSALLHADEAKRLHIDPIPFEIHELSALVVMSMAVDRLRDFVTLAILEVNPRRGHEMDQLSLALCSGRLAGLEVEVGRYEATMPDVRALKHRRNQAVHEIALQAAQIQRQHLNSKRQPTKGKKEPSVDQLTSEVDRFDEDLRRKVDQRLAHLRAHYENLIRSGDVAFRVENRRRQSPPA
jgi:hypothetical protein